jgi:hypothetical protein
MSKVVTEGIGNRKELKRAVPVIDGVGDRRRARSRRPPGSGEALPAGEELGLVGSSFP